MSERKSLLICIPELPYPVRRNGISIRYLPILEHFSESCDIDLLLILQDPVDENHLNELRVYCRNLYCFVQSAEKPGLLKRLLVNIGGFIPGRQPLEIYNYNNIEIRDFIVSKTQGKHYDVKFCVMVYYADIIRNHVSADRYVLDCIDSFYAHFIRAAKDNLVNKYKAMLMRRWEINCISRADKASLVSPMDVEVLTEGDNKIKNIEVIPNGIYIDDYADDRECIDGFVIGFLGNMDYHPNIQAALKLSDIYNSLKNEIDDLKLLIIGRNPGRGILDLQNNSNVIVTGSVESIWPYVNAVDVFVFPMNHGGGQQNKLLDVMYAGRPVISSGLGNSGIGAEKDVEIVIADTNDEVKTRLIDLYNDVDERVRLARAGKKFIEKEYEWDSIFKKIENNFFNE